MDKNLLDRLTILVLALFVSAALYFVAPKSTPVPAVQPSAPAPSCNGSCSPKQATARPFFVVCPYCKNTLTVQPSATGSGIGDVTGTVAKQAK